MAKKAKPRDDDEDEDDDRPRRKKPVRKIVDDDEDEDEDKEEDEEQEDDEPIEWTPRKRQMNLCNVGLIVMTVGLGMIAGFGGLSALSIAIWEVLCDNGKDKDWSSISWLVFQWGALSLMYLGLAALLIGMLINLATPAKVEGRGPLFGAIVCVVLVFVLGLLTLLTWNGAIVSDPIRMKRMAELLIGASVICAIGGLVSLTGYLAKLMIFIKMHLEKTQPIANVGFAVMCLLVMLGLVYLSPLLKSNIGDWLAYIVALLAGVLACVAIRALIVLSCLLAKVRATITQYIKAP